MTEFSVEYKDRDSEHWLTARPTPRSLDSALKTYEFLMGRYPHDQWRLVKIVKEVIKQNEA